METATLAIRSRDITTPLATQRSRLLELPYEVRENIYLQLLVHNSPYDARSVARRHCLDYKRHKYGVIKYHFTVPYMASVELMCTCKQIAAELHDFFAHLPIGSRRVSGGDRLSIPTARARRRGRGRGGSGRGREHKQVEEVTRSPRHTWHIRIKTRNQLKNKVGWRILACPPSYVRHLVVDVDVRGGMMDSDWDIYRHAIHIIPLSRYDILKSRMAVLFHLLNIVFYRGPDLSTHRVLKTPLKLDSLEVRLHTGDANTQIRDNFHNRDQTRHADCCTRRGVHLEGHMLYESVIRIFVPWAAENGYFSGLVRQVTTSFDNYGEIYSHTTDVERLHGTTIDNTRVGFRYFVAPRLLPIIGASGPTGGFPKNTDRSQSKDQPRQEMQVRCEL